MSFENLIIHNTGMSDKAESYELSLGLKLVLTVIITDSSKFFKMYDNTCLVELPLLVWTCCVLVDVDGM